MHGHEAMLPHLPQFLCWFALCIVILNCPAFSEKWFIWINERNEWNKNMSKYICTLSLVSWMKKYVKISLSKSLLLSQNHFHCSYRLETKGACVSGIPACTFQLSRELTNQKAKSRGNEIFMSKTCLHSDRQKSVPGAWDFPTTQGHMEATVCWHCGLCVRQPVNTITASLWSA